MGNQMDKEMEAGTSRLHVLSVLGQAGSLGGTVAYGV